MSDCGRCKMKKKDGLIGCEGSCKKWFHHTCVGLSEGDFKLLHNSKNLFFLCDTCKRSCDVVDKFTYESLNGNLENVNKTISKFNTEFFNSIMARHFDNLEVQIKQLLGKYKDEIFASVSTKIDESLRVRESVVSHGKGVSFADVIKSKSSIIVKPKNPNQPSSTTKNDIFLNIDPIKSNINVSRVHNTRGGGLVIRCDKDESTKFKELASANLGEKYEVKELSTLKPRVKIVGISENLEPETLLKYIKHQNKAIIVEDSVCDIVWIKPLRKNNRLYQAMLQTDITTYHNLIGAGKIFVGYDYCSVYDGIELQRCYKCCNFYHLAKDCNRESHTCPKCAGSHTIDKCESNAFKCILCSNLQTANHNKVIDINHAVWDRNCHIYQEHLAKLKNNILDLS